MGKWYSVGERDPKTFRTPPHKGGMMEAGWGRGTIRDRFKTHECVGKEKLNQREGRVHRVKDTEP